jgi:hypothetical protein
VLASRNDGVNLFDHGLITQELVDFIAHQKAYIAELQAALLQQAHQLQRRGKEEVHLQGPLM